MIKATKSCDDADKIATQCAWGSSADVQIAGAANDVCANAFPGRLTAAHQRAYPTLIDACKTKYAEMQGSMDLSAEAFCEESVGKLFSDLYSPSNSRFRLSKTRGELVQLTFAARAQPYVDT